MDFADTTLATWLGILAGVQIWLVLLFRNQKTQLTFRQLLMVLLAIGLVCRIAFLIYTPAFYAPDERAHFNYVKYLAEHRSFPVQTSKTDAPTNDYEYYQPPLYYLALAPAYAASMHFFESEISAMYLLRAFSILLWLANLFLAIKLLQNLSVNTPFAQIFVLGMVCLLPTYTFLSSVINNDNLLLMLGNGILCLAVQKREAYRCSILLGILLGIALLTKLTAVIYLAFVTILAMARFAREPEKRRSIVTHLGLTLILAAVIAAPWAIRNWSVYGSFTAEEVANVLRQWPSTRYAIEFTLRYMQDSFWAVSGKTNNISAYFPIVGKALFYIALAGLLYSLYKKRASRLPFLSENAALTAAMASTILINIGLVFRFGVLYGQGQGRFLFPLLIPLSLFIASGLGSFQIIRSKNAPLHFVGFFVAYVCAFTFYSLARF